MSPSCIRTGDCKETGNFSQMCSSIFYDGLVGAYSLKKEGLQRKEADQYFKLSESDTKF